MKNIPIFFTFDNNYVVPAAVTFFSLLHNAKNGIFYEMYVLHSNITSENQTLLQDIVYCKNKRNNARINFINTSNFLKNEWNNGNFDGNNLGTRFTTETIIKCFPARFLPHVDKIIYSDVDIVVQNDISELIDIDLNGYYLAGVKNVLMKYADNELSHLNDEHYKMLKDTYIGGGLWVMNLKKIREDNLEQAMLDITKNNNIAKKWPDQDIINIACKNKIKFIPLNYISLPYLIDYIKNNDFTSHYTRDELYDSIIHPKIIHYAYLKPWNSTPYKSTIWWEFFYYLELPKTNIFDNVIYDYKNPIKKNNTLKSKLRNIYYGLMLTLTNIPLLDKIFTIKFKSRIYQSINKYRLL